MQTMTNDEVKEFVKKNEWATGLKVDGSRNEIFYDNPEANCMDLKFPETPLRAPYFARILSMLDIDREELFYGAVLMVEIVGYRKSATRKDWMEISRKDAAVVRRDSPDQRRARPFISI